MDLLATSDLEDARRRWVITLVVVLLVLAGQIGFTQTTAVAAVACRGASCEGRDPQTTGCGSDARTIDSFVSNYTYVELRYSPACYAVWARGTSTRADRCGCEYVLLQAYRDRALTSYAGGASGGQPSPWRGAVWTTMKSFQYYVAACSSGPGGSPCTAWH